MKCDYYNSRQETCCLLGCKYRGQHCPFCGEWNDCAVNGNIGKAEMSKMAFTEKLEEMAKNTTIQELDITPKLSYDYLKGFYDGVMAARGKNEV